MDDRAVQHDRPRGNLGSVVDGAGLEVSDVSNNAVIPDNRRLLWCGVDHSVVLDTRARTDDDVSVVSSQDCSGPNRRMGTDSHVPDHHCVGMDECSRVDLRNEVAKGIQSHVSTVVRGGIQVVLPVP